MENDIHLIRPDAAQTMVTVLLRDMDSGEISGCEIVVPSREVLVLTPDQFSERYLESAFTVARNTCYTLKHD